MKTIHFIGIKGVGMAALAIFAKEKGYQIAGSDTEETFVTDEVLKDAGIEVTNFNSENLRHRPDLVVFSAAYGKDNPEIKEARKRKLEIKPYSEVLAMMASGSQTIAVSGIHGKTTTAALISFLLLKANLDPSYIIGSGRIPSLASPGHFGRGDYFVLEADEYRKSVEENTPKFFDLSPQIEIITSIEMDHPDMFLSEEKVYEAFYKFACRLPRNGFIVLCNDYPKAKKLLRSLADRNFETYGFHPGAGWQIIDFSESPEHTQFSLVNSSKILGPFKLKIAGRANALNATAAIITAQKLGINFELLKKNLPHFSGVTRRFEILGKAQLLTVLDDYAHHPRSIALTLEAARQKFPEAKIWAIFQPHTYSRTKELFDDFAKAFKLADKVIITDIYASARESDPSISGEDLALAIRKNQKQVKFIGSWPKIIQEVGDNLSEKTVIISIGAGDIYKLGSQIWEQLKNENKED